MKRPPAARKSAPKPRGRPKATTISVQAQKQYSAMAERFGLNGPFLTYRAIQDAINEKCGLRLSVGTVYRMAHGHMPRNRATRRALGLIKPRRPRIAWKRVALLALAAWMSREHG
jgi:hypothetical protein